MITMMPVLAITLVFSSMTTLSKNAKIIDNPVAVSYVSEDDKPLSQPELDAIIALHTRRFVRLISTEGKSKTKDNWALKFVSRGSDALIVRSIDAFRLDNIFSHVLEVSTNHLLMSSPAADWVTEPNIDSSGRATPFRIFSLPNEGPFSGILLYPSTDATIKRSNFEMTMTKPDKESERTQVSYVLPDDCGSGVGLLVKNTGQVLPIFLEKGEKKVQRDQYGLLDTPVPMLTKKLIGWPDSVDALKNIHTVQISVLSKDEISAVDNKDLSVLVKSFLNEELPRLVQWKSEVPIDLYTSVGPFEPKNKVEYESISSLLGRYDRFSIPTLDVLCSRGENGLYIAELVLKHSVLSNGGTTNAILYRNYEYGLSKATSDVFRDRVKSLIKKFADSWIKANPRSIE
jgi:hypothetical protein